MRNKVDESGCSIICIQEMKKCHFDNSFIRKFFPHPLDKFEFIPSLGASGGLLIIWNSSIFSGQVLHHEKFILSIKFTSTQINKTWILSNIYGPCSSLEKQLFIDWFKNLDIDPACLWLFLGDFNLMRWAENRNKPGGNHSEMMQFNEMISQQALI
jgi:hypothetical protein